MKQQTIPHKDKKQKKIEHLLYSLEIQYCQSIKLNVHYCITAVYKLKLKSIYV